MGSPIASRRQDSFEFLGDTFGHPQVMENLTGDAVRIAGQGEQEMFGTHVAVTKPLSFIPRIQEGPPDTHCQRIHRETIRHQAMMPRTATRWQ
jgi:hypothetical protein